MITIIVALSIIIPFLSILIYESFQPCDDRCPRCGGKMKKDKEFIKKHKMPYVFYRCKRCGFLSDLHC